MRSLVLNDFGKKIFESASCTTGLGGFAARSAIQHLERATQLMDSMPEVAAFLAITAQEESAVCIFYSLQKRKYNGAKKLKRGDHKHKSGVYPFLKFIRDVVLRELAIKVTVSFTMQKVGKKSKEVLGTVIPIPNNLGLFPYPPLNIFSSDVNGDETDYHREVKKLASIQGINSVFEYIKDLANTRNKLLYASPSGIPQISDVESLIREHVDAVICNFITYLLIEPYPKQKLVQEALNAYLKILERN